jgi:hypothetical protein
MGTGMERDKVTLSYTHNLSQAQAPRGSTVVVMGKQCCEGGDVKV